MIRGYLLQQTEEEKGDGLEGCNTARSLSLSLLRLAEIHLYALYIRAHKRPAKAIVRRVLLARIKREYRARTLITTRIGLFYYRHGLHVRMSAVESQIARERLAKHRCFFLRHEDGPRTVREGFVVIMI